MAPSLDNPHAKLDRAAEHLAVLDAETAAFFESEPYVVESEFKADVSEYVFKIKPLRQPPIRLGLILGDFAHNLRSALDHLVCQLALRDGASGCDTTQFPICIEPAGFPRVAPMWLKGLSATHVADIERLQPYHAGQGVQHHFLTILNSLDNLDKHRFVHPAFGYFNPSETQRAAYRFTLNRDAGIKRHHFIAGGRRVEGETDIARVKLAPVGPNPKVQMHGELPFDPAFGAEWIRGTSLPEIYGRVKLLIDGFAGDF